VAHKHQAFSPLSVDLVEYRAAGQVLNGLRKGSINMAAVTLDEALRIAASGEPIEVIWLFNISDGADRLISRADIPNIAALKGKRIGIEANALGAYLLQRFFSKHQLTPTDYQVVGLDMPSHAQAMQKGEVDAVMTFEPEASKLLRAGGHTLFSSKEIPGEVMDVLIVSRRAGHAPAESDIRQFISLYQRFFAQMQRHWPAYLDELNQRMKLTPEDLNRVYQEMQIPTLSEQRALLSDRVHMQQVLDHYQQALLSLKLIKKPCDCSSLINTQYLDYLH